jgi:PAS domain S-box-containing protein
VPETNKFQALLVSISNTLIQASPENIGEAIEDCLGQIGLSYGASRVGFSRIDENDHSFMVHQWSLGDRPPLPQSWDLAHLPLFGRYIAEGHSLLLNGKDDLPEDAQAERALMERLGTVALLTCPVDLKDFLIGSFFMASTTPRSVWTESTVEEIKILGASLGIAYTRGLVSSELARTNEQYRRVVEDQTELIVRWEPDGTRTWMNDRYCEFFGEPRQNLVGSSLFPFVHPDDHAGFRELISSLTVVFPVATAEHRVVLPNGNIGWQAWTSRGRFDESGSLVEIQSVGRDITAMKRAEADTHERAEFQSLLTRVSVTSQVVVYKAGTR